MMGYTEPRIYTPPLRELTPSTSLGYAACEYAKDVLGKTLYPWQEWALVHMLEIIGDLGGDWHFRYRTILVMVSRQCGKTVLSEVLASFFLNVLCVDSIFGTSLSLDKAEEVWEAKVLGEGIVAEAKWPEYDEAKCVDDTIEIVAQVNGKIKAKLNIAADAEQAEVLELAKAEPKVAEAISGMNIVKEIYIKGRLVNIVVKP